MIPRAPLPHSRLAAFDAHYGVFFAYLSVAFLLIVLIDLAPLPLTPFEQQLVRGSEIVIYVIFIAEFCWRWWLAGDRRDYLRGNWFYLLVLVLPFLRPLLFLRAANSVPALTDIAVSNRGLRGLFTLTRGRQMAYLCSLTVVVVLAGTGIVFTLEHGASGTPLTSFGETLWWSTTLITTINSSDDPVTPWGRVLAVLLRLYALGVFSYMTATAASWLISLTTVPARRSEAGAHHHPPSVPAGAIGPAPSASEATGAASPAPDGSVALPVTSATHLETGTRPGS